MAFIKIYLYSVKLEYTGSGLEVRKGELNFVDRSPILLFINVHPAGKGVRRMK